LKTSRISDGIVRLTYVAGDLALEHFGTETKILNELCSEWGVNLPDIVPTAKRFFEGYKKNSAKVKKQSLQLIELQLNYFLLDTKRSQLLIQNTDEPTPSLFMSILPLYSQRLRDNKKSVVSLGTTWIYGIYGTPFDKESMIQAVEESKKKASSRRKKEQETTETVRLLQLYRSSTTVLE
jgi:alanyl-tRNA synthetase